jgi:hypothetical protein
VSPLPGWAPAFFGTFFGDDGIMAYKVATKAENTGLDCAVFATIAEAVEAVIVAKHIFNDDQFEVVATEEPANTTFHEWNAAGW